MTTHATPIQRSRWGERVAIAAATPGTLAAIVLSLVLIFTSLRWQPHLGPFAEGVAWAVMMTPALVTVGMLTLAAGVLVVPFAPGRPRHKWGILLGGAATWWIANYWLQVRGLVELP
jgi:hypothetical protein